MCDTVAVAVAVAVAAAVAAVAVAVAATVAVAAVKWGGLRLAWMTLVIKKSRGPDA